MLTDRQQTLILDAVDGELPAAQHVQLKQLLADSPEAKQWYTALRQQKACIHQLPRAAAPRSIHASVMQRIASQPQKIERNRSRRQLHWLQLSIAASTMLAIAGLTAIIALKETPPNAVIQPQHAERTDTNPVSQPSVEQHALKSPLSPMTTDLIPEATPQVAQIPTVPETEKELQPTKNVNPPLIGFNAVTQQLPMTNTPIDIPLLTQFDELQSKAGQNQVRREMQNGSVFKIDLFTTSSSQLVKQFEASFNAARQPLLIEASTRQRIKNRIPNPPIAIYIEELTVDQLTELLADVAKRSTKASSEPLVESFHLYPADPGDIYEMNQLLGIDLNLQANDAENDDILAGTIHELTKAVGGVRPTSIVVTCLKANQQVLQRRTPDLQKFQQQRNGPKPGCKPTLIILRSVN